MAIWEPLAASSAEWRSTQGGQTTISSRSCPFTNGMKSWKNCRDCSGVLYIFQLAAISFFRGMYESFYEKFSAQENGDIEKITIHSLRLKSSAPVVAGFGRSGSTTVAPKCPLKQLKT